jgi:hypothetical protein
VTTISISPATSPNIRGCLARRRVVRRAAWLRAPGAPRDVQRMAGHPLMRAGS